MNSSTLLFFLLPTFVLIVSPSLAQQCSDNSEFCWDCSNDSGSTVYKKNLKHLISTFPSSSNNGLNVYGFYNSSFQESSNTVNAIALCRGDLSQEICQSCVFNSRQRLLERCLNRREGIIWDKRCMVRYSNNSILFARHDDPRMYVPSPNDVREPNSFKIKLKSLLNKLISRASSGNSLKKYASGKSAVLGYNTTIYATVQCTPDLDKQQCNGCLQEAAVFISQQSGTKQGTRVLKPSCNLRYEVTSFFEATNDSPVSPSNSPETVESAKKTNSSVSKFGKLAVLLCSVFLFLVVLVAYWRAKTKKREQWKRQYLNTHTTCSIYLEDHPGKKRLSEGRNNSDIPFFDLKTIAAATRNFSVDNKLGEGGFGSVYKGMLPNGEEIAVKRLSKYSGQGIEEFRNEVKLIAKLQHRNLVGILGCCVQDGEKMLIYEYLPNRSLDSFIFDETKKHVLNWRTRFNIICGIARGLLYLHQDSKLRIIHRDLKNSNVLLDATMNPKIADFGLSRIFSGDQIEAITNRVVGTYGYMSPEYAMEGLFSMKSDVYSFGVLVLEIITGKKNTGYYHEKPDSNLVGHVWDLWREDKASEVVDPVLDESFVDEALRCIQIGLLCLEEHATYRPTMSKVVSMLGNDSALPSPKQPAFVFKEGTSLLESHQLGDQELTL